MVKNPLKESLIQMVIQMNSPFNCGIMFNDPYALSLSLECEKAIDTLKSADYRD